MERGLTLATNLSAGSVGRSHEARKDNIEHVGIGAYPPTLPSPSPIISAHRPNRPVPVPSPAPDANDDLVSALHRALKHPQEGLELHYQPLVRSKTGHLVGFEALLRWTTPNGTSIDPPTIVELATSNGMAEALDLWVLQEALNCAGEWVRVKPDLMIAVNMTSALLTSPVCLNLVMGLLKRHQVSVRNLCIEVTEVLMLDDQTTLNLHELHKAGIRLAIDDFGTGMSTLSRLMDVPVDSIKLDRSFILGRTLTARDEAFLAALVRIGHARGATVTIEGVSRAEDVALARRIGCDTCQGYWYARALNSKQADAMVIANRLPWQQGSGHNA